jgi:hypothetical protein
MFISGKDSFPTPLTVTMGSGNNGFFISFMVANVLAARMYPKRVEVARTNPVQPLF